MQFEYPYGPATANLYGMCAQRHMHEYGTTSEQLAWIKVAASHHAQYNPHAMLRDVVTVEDVVKSPMVSTPLHRLDCCVISDGGGALILTKPEIAKSLKRPLVKVIGVGESPKHQMGGEVDLTYTAARWSGPPAWEMAGIKPSDIKYASIYDSFTITVLMQLEDLGFCEKGQGGKFVADGNLISGVGKLPFNTDGGGLCSNHPANRGGITKIIEAVRQFRGEAHPKVQVPNCDLAIAHGTGGALGHPPLRQHRHSGTGVIDMAYVSKKNPVRRHARDQSRNQAVLRRFRRRQADGSPVHELQEGALVSARDLCPFCFGACGWEQASGKAQDLHVQRHGTGQSALCDRLCDAGGRPKRDDQLRRLRPEGAEDRPGCEGEVHPVRE